MRDGWRLAVGTLTVLPTRAPGVVDRGVAGRAMVLAPVVGILLGGIAAGVVAAAEWVRADAPILTAVLGLAALVIFSGGLHLDGLADTADALGSRRDRGTMLAIMRTGDIGPFGVTAIVLMLLIDTAALAACVTAGIGWQAVLVAAVAGRLTLPIACRAGVPPARPEGLGATVAGTVRPWLAATVAVVATTAAAAVLLPAGGRAAAGAAVGVVLAATAGLAVTRVAVRRFGGVTGDVLGCGVELGTCGALLALALVAGS